MNKIFNDFLEKVEKYLSPLPISERMDIIQEIKSQISELETAGKSPEEILERLRNPKDLAKAYLSSLITNQKASRRNKIAALCAYYTLASFTGIIVIPILLICAPVFIFCSVVTPILTLLKMLNHLLNLGLPNLNHIVSLGAFQFDPIWEFLLSLPISALLFSIGWGCWKLLLIYITGMGKAKRYITSERE